MLGLAGGVALVEGRAAVLKAVQHGLVHLGTVGHGNLCDERGTVPGGKGLGHALLLDELAL